MIALGLLISLLAVALTSAPVEAGSCFKIRLENGRCHDLIQRNHISRSECCRLGGFYTSARISDSQYVRNILLHKSGIPNCQYSCHSALEYLLGFGVETCERVSCPPGFKCKVQKGKAVCACSSTCSSEDFKSGPVCTTDFRMFRNRCSFMKERCRDLDTLLMEMPCPPDENVCDYKRNSSQFVDEDDGIPMRICPNGEVCIVRQFSGKSTCEDPKFLGRNRIETAFDGVEVSPIDACANGPYGGPLCGVDNKTYSNQCHLRKASIERGMEIRIAYMGACKADARCGEVRCPSHNMICVPHVETNQPVCMDCTDLPTNCNPHIFSSSNSVEIAEFTLLGLAKETNQNFGDPRWHGNVFTNGWPGVCGSGRRSFPNACFMHVYNCLAKRFVDIVSTGYCPG